ncbi:hypothetical protein B0T11DRAFT_116833 [Plectosphaerella cucumerina]|uniref:Uncharacterized protein n=1 Tax=Plectosphaerella cucumerina TaxID=40658 RepID=A0A8K0T7K5_9PEZI|nr:hypothetical protein B0T11DRAFT_116833 [Plectosphaerella cucumerina]
MASTDPEPPSAAAGTAIHPLTCEDAASHARRYYARVTQKASGPKIDSYYTYRQLERDPAFTEAANWPSYFLSFPDDDDAIFQMFRPPVSPELELWLLEYIRVKWPDVDLSGVMTITADRTLHPLHIAAAIGLPSLVQRIAEEYKDSVNQLSVIGTPLYCALVGPTIFQQQGHRGSKSQDLATCLSLAKAESIHALLDAGAKGLNMTRPRFNTTFSVQWLAFEVCQYLCSPELFRRLYPPAQDRLGIEVDLQFTKHVTFPQEANFDPYGPQPHSKTVSERRRAYFEMLLVAFDGQLVNYGSVDNFTLLDNMWAGINRFWDLGGYDGTPFLSKIMPLHNTSDSQFHQLVRRAIDNLQVPVVTRLSCDPRFDPNLPLFDPSEIGDDHDDKGATLLHSVVRADDYALAILLMFRGADTRARDALGRTPLILCESPSMLKVVVANGGKTTDIDHLGRNIYHYAAACNDSELLEYLIENDPNRDEALTTRMLHDGLTPAAQAIVYPLVNFETEPRHSFFQIDMAKHLRGAVMLLTCGSSIPGSLHSDDVGSLTKAALRWSDEGLVGAMRKCGFRFDHVDEEGNTALHRISFAATGKLTRHLLEDCSTLPMLNNAGMSPLITIFENTYIPNSPISGRLAAMPHPVPKNFIGILDDKAYEELVHATVAAAPEGEERDQALAACFESFFDRIITVLPSDPGPLVELPLHESLVVAMRVFKKLKVLHAYWKLRGKSPAAGIARNFCAKKSTDLRQNPWWRYVMISLFAESLESPWRKERFSRLRKEDKAAFEDMLEWILLDYNHEESENEHLALLRALHFFFPIPAKVKGVPTVLAACRSRCSDKMLDIILCVAPPLANEEELAAARACLENDRFDGEMRLGLLDDHLERAARRSADSEGGGEEGEDEDEDAEEGREIPDEPCALQERPT